MKIITYIFCIAVGILALYVPEIDTTSPFGINAIVPTVSFQIPVVVNSGVWLYTVLFTGLITAYLLFTNLHTALKILAFYLFASCFVSFIPYRSFNATILLIPAFYLFMLVKKLDRGIIINLCCALFVLQVLFIVAQFFGKDVLLNYGHSKPVVFGTVMQGMRAGSLFCVLAPFLLLHNKLWIIPLAIVAIVLQSAAFALALVVGAMVYVYLYRYKHGRLIILVLVFMGLLYALYDHGSFETAIGIGRIPRWLDIIYTGSHDTLASLPAKLSGPWDIKAIFFGRGLDTFMDLFPYFVHDKNPFGQAHNSFLQLWWETGLIGLGIVITYLVLLLKKLLIFGEYVLIAGLAILSVNYFFAFPDRMFQTNILLVVFLAMCHWRIYGNYKQTICS